MRTDGQTGGHDEANVMSSKFFERASNAWRRSYRHSFVRHGVGRDLVLEQV
jgi:hypothetical protein